MDLGKKLLQARQEAGLSQKALCADVITRNMLSQIEHGTARPSMDTLRQLAARLGKPISYFLDEESVISPNHQRMTQARIAYDAGKYEAALEILRSYQNPDLIFDREKALLAVLCQLSLAEEALRQNKYLYAKELLENTNTASSYSIPELERRRLLLIGKLPDANPTAICTALSDMDEELMLRANAALAQGQAERASELLAAAENKSASRWNLLQGKALYARNQYAAAADCLKIAEMDYPRDCWPMLEVIFRQLKDFEQAYHYACKQKEK